MGTSKTSKKEDAVGGTSGPLTVMDQPKLQAVILADSFLTTFQPLSLDLPKVLCPLNNVTLLNYAMDCLAGNGVEQVFVVCTNDQIEQELQQDNTPGRSQTKQTWQGRMSIECIKDTSLTNSGDALRELYKRNAIQSDPFLLVFGDVVTNMDLSHALQAHQQRHAHDSAAIMTLVLNAAGAQSPIQSAKNDLVVGYDPTQQNRVLLYDNHSSQSSVALPCSFFAAHPEMVVRTDLMDTGVFICSPDVLGRFEDEFDYLDIAQDFVTNCVAEEEEGLQTRIHAHIVGPTEYAARIVDWATYHAVSRDLLRRWCYPIVADNLHSTTTTPQLYKSSSAAISSTSAKAKSISSSSSSSPYYLYKESLQPSKVARSSTVQGPGMLGGRGQIHEKASIVSSILGHGVEIGAGAVIQESHLWDSVTVHSNAKVVQSILAKDVVIMSGAVVSRGCIIGQGCVIGENVVLPEYTRITLQEDDNDPFRDDEGAIGFDEDWTEGKTNNTSVKPQDAPDLVLETDTQVVGKDGKGRVWHPSLEEDGDSDEDDDDDDDRDEEDANAGLSNLHLQSIGTDLTGYYQKRLQRQAEPEDDGFSEAGLDNEAELIETEAFAAYTEGAFTFADTPSAPTAVAPAVVGRQRGVDVVKELKEICMEFNDNGNTPMENLVIELNSYKFSQNASYSDCTMAAILAMMEKLEITPDMSDGKLVSGIKHKLEFWSPLLQKMSIGQAEELAIVHGLERAATATSKDGLTPAAQKLSSGLSFRFFLQTLHDQEVLSEESLLAWAEHRKTEPAEDSPIGKLFRMQSVQDFLEWLEEDDDDDDDEGSSSGEVEGDSD